MFDKQYILDYHTLHINLSPIKLVVNVLVFKTKILRE